MFGDKSNKFTKTLDERRNTVTDAVSSAPEALERDAGKLGSLLVRALDTAMSWQTSTINAYASRLHKQKPTESPAEIQKRIDSHYLAIVTGTGGAAGSASLIPGIGFFTGMAAVAGESILFLEASAWHTLASATLRGIDISQPERRRALILAAMSGASGTALVAAAFGEESLRKRAKAPASSVISSLGLPQLGLVNKFLFDQAKKRLMKNARLAVIGKLLPLGAGAVIGATANRKMGNSMIDGTRTSLGPLPQSWDEFDGTGTRAITE